MTGKDSSSSAPSTSVDDYFENHSSPHWILTLTPKGKMLLTTPDKIDMATMEHVSGVVQRWLTAEDQYPLVIGDCLVQLVQMEPVEVSVAGA